MRSLFINFFMKQVFKESGNQRQSFVDDYKEIYKYIDKNDSADEKADKIFKLMTQKEKLEMLSGYEWFAVKPIPRLGVDAMWMADATSGIRQVGKSTVFPCNVSMTATWDREKIKKASSAIAQECRAKGISVLLAPGVNIHRVPTCGRNFEYMGEDPYLAGEMACSYIEGVQKEGVAASIKHYALNNSDWDRNRTSSNVDERTLREIYLPPFEMAVKKADVKSVMTSYNLVNGVGASENKLLITDILKNEWGFKGFVMSDWVSVYDAEKSIKGGLDIEMPGNQQYTVKKLERLLKNGKIAQPDIDDKVKRMLRTFFSTGAYERSIVDKSYLEYGADHIEIAREIASDGIVLLKNKDNILPLKSHKVSTVAVLGPMATKTETGGGGSSKAKCYDTISLYEGLVKQAPEDISVQYVYSGNDELLKSADAVVVCVGFSSVYETEMSERSWTLPLSQVKLIRKCTKLNKNVIVVLNTGSSVETSSWINEVSGLVDIFYPGQIGGYPLADVIFGKVNPSGKLPFTFPAKFNDISATKNYCKKPGRFNLIGFLGAGGLKIMRWRKNMDYKEGVFVGYRDLEHNNKKPSYAFGFGLSYSTFELSNLQLSSSTMKKSDKLKVTVDIKNSSDIDGKEVVQLYIADKEASVERPVKELKGFEKVELKANETKKVEFTIKAEDLSFWDIEKHTFFAEAGEFDILIGNSSDNIVLQKSFTLV